MQKGGCSGKARAFCFGKTVRKRMFFFFLVGWFRNLGKILLIEFPGECFGWEKWFVFRSYTGSLR